jgi:hypothetical protein
MLNIIIAIVLVQNVNSFDGKKDPGLNQLDKTIKVIRVINGIK